MLLLRSNCRHIRGRNLAVVISLLLSNLCAFGALGGDASSVNADAVHMQAALTTTRAANYTVQEMQSPAGVTVREYVSPAGKVFAIAWNGPFPPDLKQLLGTYSAPFQQAVQNQPPGHHPVSIRQSNLVVQLSGHMGSFSGRAYLADQLPAGVGAEAIR